MLEMGCDASHSHKAKCDFLDLFASVPPTLYALCTPEKQSAALTAQANWQYKESTMASQANAFIPTRASQCVFVVIATSQPGLSISAIKVASFRATMTTRPSTQGKVCR
jgi:hypothetical protein